MPKGQRPHEPQHADRQTEDPQDLTELDQTTEAAVQFDTAMGPHGALERVQPGCQEDHRRHHGEAVAGDRPDTPVRPGNAASWLLGRRLVALCRWRRRDGHADVSHAFRDLASQSRSAEPSRTFHDHEAMKFAVLRETTRTPATHVASIWSIEELYLTKIPAANLPHAWG
jgi:hypothetical protein